MKARLPPEWPAALFALGLLSLALAIVFTTGDNPIAGGINAGSLLAGCITFAAVVFAGLQLAAMRKQAAIAQLPTLERKLGHAADLYDLVSSIRARLSELHEAVLLLDRFSANDVVPRAIQVQVETTLGLREPFEFLRARVIHYSEDRRLDGDLTQLAKDLTLATDLRADQASSMFLTVLSSMSEDDAVVERDGLQRLRLSGLIEGALAAIRSAQSSALDAQKSLDGLIETVKRRKESAIMTVSDA
ncbi:MAG TPA: hypothetical protein VF601_00990 [Beijerinckiaceae bacterium]